LLSILSCYGTLGVITGLSLMGVTLAVNVHVWAAAIMVFALLAVLGLTLGYRQHRSSGALVLGMLGALVVIFSLYGGHGPFERWVYPEMRSKSLGLLVSSLRQFGTGD